VAKQSIAALLERVAAALNAMPDVFSTLQWGGRAYKLPGPGGSRRKPKLLAHVVLEKDGKAIFIDFKLPKDRARGVIKSLAWIKPHSFRTLAPSGWVAATIQTKRQCDEAIKLLLESRAVHPLMKATEDRPALDQSRAASNAVARRIESVMRDKRASGWRPRSAEELDVKAAPRPSSSSVTSRGRAGRPARRRAGR